MTRYEFEFGVRDECSNSYSTVLYIEKPPLFVWFTRVSKAYRFIVYAKVVLRLCRGNEALGTLETSCAPGSL